MISLFSRTSGYLKSYPTKLLAISVEGFHISSQQHGTHDYKQEEFQFSQEKLQYVIEKYSDIHKIRKITNAAIRLAENSETDESGNTMNKLFVIGSADSRKKAVELLNEFLNERYQPTAVSQTNDDSKLLWHGYKRNYKGQYAPLKPRKKCIRCGGKMLSGNPCPLCQMKLDSNYDVHYTDVEILNQFICPHTWKILDPYKTNICKNQHLQVVKAITKARNHGLIPFTMPSTTQDETKFKPAGVPTDKLIKVKIH